MRLTARIIVLSCNDLARGDKTQQDVTLLLGKNHVDINSIPAEGSVLSLLINGNKPGQAYVCNLPCDIA